MSKVRWVVVMAIMAVGLAGVAGAVSPLLKEMEDGFVRLGELVRPAVVEVKTAGAVSDQRGMPDAERMEEMFRFFGLPAPEGMPQEMPQRFVRGMGSGFIVDKEGHILTNNHVVEEAENIKVKMYDGKEYEAKVVGRDPETDVAVIKIDPAGADLPVAKLGNSDNLKVGQFAVAMGNPGGLEGTLSFGHISALGREGLPLEKLDFQGLIQTDAAINLGNSGGPLCNIDGEVIGINVAMVWGAQSVGFAIPINTAAQVLPELMEKGKVTRGFLGVDIQDAKLFTQDESLGLPDESGAFVQVVRPNTPAERAGIQVYDVIRKVNGEPVKDATDLRSRISAMAPSANAKLEVWRNRAPVEIEVNLEERPTDVATGPESAPNPLGMRVGNLTPQIMERLGLDADTKGVVVKQVEPGSPADDAGIRGGNIVVEVARQPVANDDQFRQLVKENAKPGKSLMMRIIGPDKTPMVLVIHIPNDWKGE